MVDDFFSQGVLKGHARACARACAKFCAGVTLMMTCRQTLKAHFVPSKQNFESDLIGSTQLNKRPMSRVIDPLVNEGAKISGTGGSLPIKIKPSDYSFENIHSTKPSAQVKSSFLLASLYHKVPTTISEIVLTRDHSESCLLYTSPSQRDATL